MLLSVIQQAGFGPIELIAKLLGWFLNLIYELLSKVGIENAALCIIVFTVLVKLLMIPMNYKQQKSQKLMNVVQPEIQKITEKYKGKKDNASMMKQQNEMQAVYDKYGTTPTGGCLTSLIAMLIMFGLYRVVYSIYLYIPAINDLYTEISQAIVDSGLKYGKILQDLKVSGSTYNGSANPDEINKVLNMLKPDQWNDLAKAFAGSSNECVQIINANSHKLINIHSFIFGMNIKYSPIDVKWPGMLIPIFALATQLFSTHQMSKKTMQNQDSKDNPMMQSMMMTTKIMPIFSFFICVSMPIGAGIYWVLSGLLQIIQQFIFDFHFDKMDVDELVKANVEKASKNKKKKKKSYLQQLMEAQEEMEGNKSSQPSTLKDYAHLNSRNYGEINNESNVEFSSDDVEVKPGSISSYANIMRNSNRK